MRHFRALGKGSHAPRKPTDPTHGQHIIWYPESVMHDVNQNFSHSGVKNGAGGERKEFFIYFLGYWRYLKYFFLVHSWNFESMHLSSMTIIFPTVETFKRILVSVKFLMNMKKWILHGGCPGVTAKNQEPMRPRAGGLQHGPLTPRVPWPPPHWLPDRPSCCCHQRHFQL